MSKLDIGELADARDKLAEVHYLLERIEAAAREPSVQVPEVHSSPKTGLQNAGAFYDYIRGDAGELFPTMKQSQFEGVEATLKAASGKLPLSWCAYCLATEYHETAKTMQGVREGLDVSDSWRRKHLRYFPWYGRGKAQLTWEANYRKATKRLRELGYDVDLIANPDQALDLDISAVILVVGMLEGWFTGKKLRDYIPQNPTLQHYTNARRIVNAMDRAQLIAGYAVEFEKALKAGDWQ